MVGRRVPPASKSSRCVGLLAGCKIRGSMRFEVIILVHSTMGGTCMQVLRRVPLHEILSGEVSIRDKSK